MTTTTRGLPQTGEVQRYADAVRAALLDVAPAQRDELVEDLVDHLREVAAEGDGPLSDRLGTPEAYAHELRASLDLPPAGESTTVSIDEQLRALYRRARGTRLGNELAAYLPTLRPAWWLVRAWLVVLTLAVMSGFYPYGAFSVVIPRIGASRTLGLLLLILLGAASVRLGQREVQSRHRDARVALNTLVVIAGLLATMALMSRTSYRYVVSPASSSPGQNQQGHAIVLDRNGNQVTNLEVRTPDGKRIEGALIYTQDGQPLDNLADVGGDELGRQLVIHPERDAAGNIVHNSYPRHFDTLDPATGQQVATAAPSAPPAGADPAPTPSVSPTPAVSATAAEPSPSTTGSSASAPARGAAPAPRGSAPSAAASAH